MNSPTLIAARFAALLIALAGAVCSPAVADPVPATAATPSGKLAASFSDFAGSPENSASLVNGLRTGAPITLTDPAIAGGPPPNSTTFTSPTKPMGYGNVRIALSLAQAQLASEGISNPTAAELQGALVGRTYVGPEGTTTTDGVLQMRASGMGWGKIANTMGYKLGPVVSGKQTLVASDRADNSVTTAVGPGASAGRAKGVATASGGVSDGNKGVVTGSGGASDGSKGVVTGSGGAPGGGKGVVTGSSGAAGGGKGVVTGSSGAGGGGKGVVTGSSGAGGGKGVVTGAGNAAHGQSSGITTGLGHASANAGGVTSAAGSKAGANAGGGAKGGGKP
jgi:hypothetical protein